MPLTEVFTQFRINSPQLQVNIDRNKAKSIGISLTDIFNTMKTQLGSLYVNDFNYLNRSCHVYVQADAPFRNRIASLQQIYVRFRLDRDQHSDRYQPICDAAAGPAPRRHATGGLMTPVTRHEREDGCGPPIITHYNLYRNIEIHGSAAPGHGSGEAIEAMQQIAKKIEPPGVIVRVVGLPARRNFRRLASLS